MNADCRDVCEYRYDVTPDDPVEQPDGAYLGHVLEEFSNYAPSSGATNFRCEKESEDAARVACNEGLCCGTSTPYDVAFDITFAIETCQRTETT